jgi:CRISPR-associated protein Cas6
VPTIDLAFELSGTSIPLDYGYALFGAISRIVPAIHGDRRIGVHPIRGIKTGPGRLSLVPQSRLRLRLPSEEIGMYLPVAGARLDLQGSLVRVGVPRAETLEPFTALVSRIVTIGHHSESGEFLESVNRQLIEMQVQPSAELVRSSDPSRAGQPSRRILKVKDRKLVGYAVRIEGLSDMESLILQRNGLGSRRRMGCGVFLPDRACSSRQRGL